MSVPTSHPASPLKLSVAAHRNLSLSTKKDRFQPNRTSSARFSDPFADQHTSTAARPQRDATPHPSQRAMRDGRRVAATSPPLPTGNPRATSVDPRDDAERFDINAHRQAEQEKWLRRNEPRPLKGKEYRMALRILITEAAAYHARNGSNALNHRIAGALLAKNRGGLPTDLPVDVHSCKISARVVRQLFTDVDNICDHYQDGPRLALQALQEMSLWRR